MVIRKYSSKFTLGEHPIVKFKTASTLAPGRVEVPTTLLYQGSQYNVTYRLEEAEGWRITDVVVEGVSFVANYRTQFDAQFKKGGSNAVIGALSQSVARPKMKRHTSIAVHWSSCWWSVPLLIDACASNPASSRQPTFAAVGDNKVKAKPVKAEEDDLDEYSTLLVSDPWEPVNRAIFGLTMASIPFCFGRFPKSMRQSCPNRSARDSTMPTRT